MAVHDRFGQAGRAAGVDDPQRVLEIQPGRLGQVSLCREGFEVVRTALRAGKTSRVGPRVETTQQHGMAHARQRIEQLNQQCLPVVRHAPIDIAVTADQDTGFDLAEAVEHRHRAHVGRTHRPDRADARTRQKCHHRLRHVGQEGADAVARFDAHAHIGRSERTDLAAQFGPTQGLQFAALAKALTLEHDRRLLRAVVHFGMAEQVRRIVEPRPWKPARPGHHRVDQHLRPGRR